jgi:hypothetical protein
VHGLAVILVVIAGLAACGPASTQVPPSGSAAVSSPEPISPVEGVITHVESAGLDRVSGFTLRTADGVLLDFMIGMLENGDEFPPGHLTEHQATSDPVRVFFTVEGGVLVATRLEDAGG